MPPCQLTADEKSGVKIDEDACTVAGPLWNGLFENPLAVKSVGPVSPHVPENPKLTVL